jgi:3D (Asp-Asp-Asp) domain-containing protein
LVLAGWLVPDRIAVAISRLRTDFPVGRTVLAAVVCAGIIAPTVLYQRERSRRLETTRAFRHLSTSSGIEVGALSRSLESLLAEQQELRTMLLDAGYAVASDGNLAVRVLATGYSSSVWETDDTPFITASNTPTRPGVVALSRDLLTRHNPNAPFSFGDVIQISGIGEFDVEDSMHWRWRRRADIWFPSRDAAWHFGKREVTISMPFDQTERSGAVAVKDADSDADYVANSGITQ